MDTSALKSFAPEVRRQLLEAVERKLDFVLTADTADLRAAHTQVDRLRGQAEAGRAQLIERVAYTWFNRLAALRFLDARGWHPFRARVLTPASPRETQPEVLRLVRTGALPAELAAHTDSDRLNDLLDGRLPSFDPQAEVHRQLVLAACRFYQALLPFLFERLDDETELLLPDDLLTEHSVAQGFRTAITDADCDEVEVLGWLYQFYISEKKDQVMARKGAVASEDIPAVTQLFTPHWIVRYLVENSLGRLWLRSRPGSSLRAAMPYYVDDPEGRAPADALTVSRPEEIRLLDPACGSGHMLTYAFDLLFQIYEEEGHAPREIPQKILTHNLHGLEICPRATQLAQFALLAKAREHSPRAFHEAVQPQVTCLQDVAFAPDEVRSWRDAGGLSAAISEKVLKQLYQFREDTATLGSLIQPVLDGKELQAFREAIAQAPPPTDLLHSETQRKVTLVLDQVEMLSRRYQVMVTNPPYMGGEAMTPPLKNLFDWQYPNSRGNLYAGFIERGGSLIVRRGECGMITMQNWMFLGSFSKFRNAFLHGNTLTSLLHLGSGAFGSISGEVVQTAAFVFTPGMTRSDPALFIRLVESPSESEKEREFLRKLAAGLWSLIRAQDFEAIPGSPLAYWLTTEMLALFRSGTPLGAVSEAREGLSTGCNERHVRLWHEVAGSRSHTCARSRQEGMECGCRWFAYNKGGTLRRWFGNTNWLVNWENDGFELQNTLDPSGKRIWAHNFNLDYIFRPAVSWSDIATNGLSARFYPHGFVFDATGLSAFCEDEAMMKAILGLLNTRLANEMALALNPTMHFKTGDFRRLPLPLGLEPTAIAAVADSAVSLARADWDSFETSWNFQDLPLLHAELKGRTLEESWRNWESYLESNIARMQELETENNRLWIEAYGLEDGLPPEVPAEEVTLARPDRRKDVAAFLSYAVGCMMGRYSLDAPGLILADAGATLEDYVAKVGKPPDELAFVPDEDGIIPVLGGEWFEDDVVARTRDFLRTTFGEATLEENLRFIEEALGKDLRRYFVSDFFKDHLQTYKKRPIYWLYQSPKKGFQCLAYLHRYTHDTPNRVLNRYLREYIAKVGYRLEHLEHVLASESTPAREKTWARKESDELRRVQHECEEWEREVLLPLAQQRLDLDLDDGVKVNYLKLGKALAPIPGLTGRGEE
jgi:Eco57I restriction-modification methylase